MKVTVSNMTEKPLNISRLAPLLPVQVLGVKQEIKVNVKDIDAVIKKAAEIGVTVTPMDEAFKVTETTEPKSNIVDTTKPEDNSDEIDKEPVGDVSEDTTDKVVDNGTGTNEVAPETDKTDDVENVTPVKSKRGRKSTKTKASVLKSIIGNNK